MTDTTAAEPAFPTRMRIGECECRLVCVDNVVPMPQDAGPGTHPRLVYVAGEVVHFDLDGHRWAIVPEAAVGMQANDSPGILSLLTNRELQIVQFICLGYLTKQVAHRLGLSEFTVRSYLKTVYCKLGVRSRGAMVFRYAQAFAKADARTAQRM